MVVDGALTRIQRVFRHPLVDVVWLVGYLLALVYWRDVVPDGLVNDAAEEALRGIDLVEGRKFEVITSSLGNSAETLYLYGLGASAKLFGATTLAVQLPSWITALAVIWLFMRILERMDISARWMPPLAVVSSLWLFHYARSGLRAISAPFFLLAFWLLLDRAERFDERRLPAVACGAALGLSIYAYTSCRVLLVVFLVYALVRLLQSMPHSARLLRCYAFISLGIVIVSLPNLWALLQAPGEFISRGSYVLRGGIEDKLTNLLWTFLLPFSAYRDIYRELQGPSHYFDGVSAALTSAGFTPIHPLIAVAFVGGLWRIWKTRREKTSLFVLISWIAATLILGIAGPSLTRMLIALPVYLAIAALGVDMFLKRLPSFAPAVALALATLTVYQGYAYFTRLPESKAASFYFGPVATPMGRRAAVLLARGERVLCATLKDANVIRYLTHGHIGQLGILEFYAPQRQEIALEDFAGGIFLVENDQNFASLIQLFAVNDRTVQWPRFYEIRLPEA
jgi:hypothetical protein